MSIFMHMQGIHSNFHQVNGFKFHRVHKCEHGVANTKRSDYLNLKNPAHLKAFNNLWDMVATEKRLKDLEKVSPYHTTSEVESFNAHANFPMRVQLTVLHWNHLKLD
ncbi:Protein CBG27312 [Caenorhabditis briggsae]|uniref:Protein CBG27312 n=1 Tax=Caenorhabditis briggsae TaxID=6238 RepID=B6IFG4_CAEBR|nr:Protein CBG27312 [Caenorhabditis briggsae]CAR98644.1 Protein CBG27312 [Caenorhabditis briggsae]